MTTDESAVACAQYGITARISRIGVDASERLGRHRWVLERTIAWLLAFPRPAIRYDRNATTITAVATLAITVICARRLLQKNYRNHLEDFPAPH